MRHHILPSIVVLGYLAQVVRSQDCSAATLQQCEAAFNGVTFPSNFTFNDALPLWNDTLPICLAMSTFSTCVNTVYPHCSIDLELSLEGETAAYQYLCQNASEYLSYSKCFAVKAAQKNKVLCQTILQLKLSKLENVTDEATKFPAECQYYNDYGNCITNSITTLCGAAASNWVNNYLSFLYTPVMTYLQCQGYGTADPGAYVTSDDSTWTVILGVVLGISALILVGGVVILLALVGRKRKQRSRRQRRTGNGNAVPDGGQPLPPPYTGPFVIYEPPGADGEPQVRLVDSQETLPGQSAGVVGLQPNSGLNYKSPILPPPYSLIASSNAVENQPRETRDQPTETSDQPTDTELQPTETDIQLRNNSQGTNGNGQPEESGCQSNV